MEGQNKPTPPAQEAPKPGTPEHDAAMVALYESRNGAVQEEGATAAPAAKPAAQEAPKQEGEAPAKQPDEGTQEGTQDDAAKAAVQNAGLDFDKLASEFAEKGALSDDSYKSLEESGIPREQVDAYIEGRRAVQELRDMRGMQAAGGPEEFSKMTAWASQALTDAEREAFNTACASGTEAEMIQAVTSLKARYEAEYGREPNLLGGSRPNSGGVEGYESRAQMTSEMNERDSRGRRLYDIDPAFRAKVQRRIAASNFL